MKKIVSFVFAALFTSLIFAEFFGPRFFEMTVCAPVSVTNNAFMLDDIMKENAVLDLGKLADNLPDSGFNVITTANPYYGTNINIKDFHLGVKTGVDYFGKFTVSKDLFDFIGNGNDLYEDIDIEAIVTGDVFAHADLNLAFKAGKGRIGFTPSLFVPLAHITTEDSKTTISNSEDGAIGINMLSKAAMYTLFDFNDTEFVSTMILNGLGFDIAGEFEYPYSSMVAFSGSLRMPIYPGHLSSVSYYNMSMNFKTKLTDLADGNMGDFKPEIESGLAEPASYSIHRPFKLNVQADFTPLGDFLVISSGFGIGIRNPFAENQNETKVYPEYYFGCKLISKGIAMGCVSTEYKDEIFKHQIAGMFNLRLFQLETGFAAASASIASSFRGAGVSAYVITSWGF